MDIPASSHPPTVDMTWDRGTLLLRGPKILGEVEGVVWDPRVDAWRAPAHLHAALLARAQLRGLAITDRARGCEPAPHPFEVPPLRPYQEDALVAWEGAGRRGILVLPTGAGKTRTAIAAMARARVSTLVLVPTRILLEQWSGALREAGAGPVGRHGDGERTVAAITVSTFASANRHMETLGNHFELLVVDEVHHFGALAGDECLEMCTAAWRLGLTATHPDDAGRAGRLAQVVGPAVYACTVGELTGRFLAPLRLVTLSLALSADEARRHAAELAVWRPVVRQFFESVPEASWPDFVAAANRSESGRRALAAWSRSRALLRFTEAKRATVERLLTRHASARVLLFTPDAVTAYTMSRAHLVPAITADIGRAERARLLREFADGTLHAIVSARVLNEGVDVPEADVAVIVGGSQGAREYVQRVGRVLRPAPGKEATVYELVTRGTGEGARAEERQMRLDAC